MKSQPRLIRGATPGETLAVTTRDGVVALRVHVGETGATIPLHAGSALKLAEHLLRHGRKLLIPKPAPAEVKA